MNKKELEHEYLKEILNYDPSTGIFTNKITRNSRAVKGKRAGNLRPQGKRTLTINKVNYQESTLAWFYITGVWPDETILHINEDLSDNRISNLKVGPSAPISSPNEEGAEKRNLLISFSGGKTSGYMTNWLLTEYASRYNIVVVFANTGEENLKTLEFVRDCDTYLNFNTVWLEAVVHEELGVGTGCRIVNFKTASRKGEPFEDVIKKYGIPNVSYPHCTKELKQRPIIKYARHNLGWKHFETAIGIRDDELKRVPKKVVSGNNKLIYPLVHWTTKDITKAYIKDWWNNQSFNLDLEEHQGNCKTCWKKTLSKHKLIMTETPEYYDFNTKMEELYHSRGSGPGNRVFFRGNKSTTDLFELTYSDIKNDDSYGCPADTCEPFIV